MVTRVLWCFLMRKFLNYFCRRCRWCRWYKSFLAIALKGNTYLIFFDSNSTEDSLIPRFWSNINIKYNPIFRIRRGGSRGFVLTEDSMDDDFYINSLIQEKEWLDKFRKKLNGSILNFDTHQKLMFLNNSFPS